MIPFLAALNALLAAGGTSAPGVDLTSVVIAIIAGIGGAGGAAILTRAATNRRLDAEGDKLKQEALLAAEERGQQAVATVDKVRRILEERLSQTERDLEQTRRDLERAEAKIRELQAQIEGGAAERVAILERAAREREALQRRLEELERQTFDLRARAEPSRRHTDRPPETPDDAP